jgi:hypothetical protein
MLESGEVTNRMSIVLDEFAADTLIDGIMVNWIISISHDDDFIFLNYTEVLKLYTICPIE